MNNCIEILNSWGADFAGFAWPMLWQSSLLIAIVLLFDLLFARRVRASVRYALWMVVLLKLVLPPALALPTSATWWLWRPTPVALPPMAQNYTVSFGNAVPDTVVPANVPIVIPPAKLTAEAWSLLAASAAAFGILLCLTLLWLKMAAKIRRAPAAPAELIALLKEACQSAGLRRCPRLKLIGDTQSPAVYGLFQPVVLLPQALAAKLSAGQLRAVLLHEAIHLRRGDVWVNCAQTLLQIVYWWHPLVWIANARIRRAREEAVDDAVMLALREGTDAYAPTLLEVAKFALRHPLASLGFVGILESRSALRRRVERLVNFRPPRRAGITVLSLFGVFAFSIVALPMGQGPAAGEQPVSSIAKDATNSEGNHSLTETFVIRKPIQKEDLRQLLLKASVKAPPTIYIFLNNRNLLVRGTADQLADVTQAIKKLNGYSTAPPLASNVRVTVFRKYVHASPKNPQRDAVLAKLDSIHIDVSYENEPLSHVLEDLNKRSAELDADKQGVNFMYGADFRTIDPSTGSATGPVKSIAITHVKIKANLKNVTLQDVLKEICLGSDPPIEYSVKDYGVVLSPRDTNFTQCEMRTFKVSPVFCSNLVASVAYRVAPDERSNISALAATLFSKLGVNLSLPKTVFFNEKLGVLFVYATADDLNVVEKAIEALSGAPPMLHIKARFIEVSSADSMLPGMTNGAVLTTVELSDVLYRLESQKGSSELAEPEVTTINGREVEMRATVQQPVITGYRIGTNAPYLQPQITSVETGPIFDVYPTVRADGHTLGLGISTMVIKFCGYADSGGLPQHYGTTPSGEKIKLPISLPAIQLNTMSMEKDINDGQTLVLFLLPAPASETAGEMNAASRELVARYIRKVEKKRNDVIVAFVTATLIDSAGNRLHPHNQTHLARSQ